MDTPIHAQPRILRLRERLMNAEHARHRVGLPDTWSVAHMDCSLPERAGHALVKLCDESPIAIEPDELIVGVRTMLAVDPAVHTPDDGWASPLPEVHDEPLDHRERTHNVFGFGKVLREGYGSLIAKCEARLADETDPAKQDHLKGFILACRAMGLLAVRYADLANFMAADTDDPVRSEELRTIADVCRHIATGKPRNLQDALQLYWFTWLVALQEQGALVSAGRFDQHVAPYWPEAEADQAHAQELIDCYVLKCNDMSDAWTPLSSINNLHIISGLKPDGTDGTNPASWALLESVARLQLPDPQPAVRLHKDTPPEFVRFVLGLMRDGASQICIFNDDTFVPALQSAGFAAEDARDYALDACQDVLIEGKSNFYLGGNIAMTHLLLGTLERVDGDIDWAGFYQAYRDDLASEIEHQLAGFVKHYHSRGVAHPSPLMSVTMDDCIERGLDVTDGGLRLRDKGVFLAEPVCAINSLAAVRHIVFDTQAATLDELRQALKTNFADAESLRQQCLAAPKWGNDDDACDVLASEVFSFGADEIHKYRIDEEAGFLSGIHQPHQVMAGHGLPATPDGRRDNEGISVTLAPANGTDQQGPTAVMRSVTKIDPMVCQWNHSLTMTFDPGPFAGDDGLDKFVALVGAYMAMGGPQLQVNFLNRSILESAQAHPEEFRNLIVRVWGYCARFIDLDAEYQQDIISRTAHSL